MTQSSYFTLRQAVPAVNIRPSMALTVGVHPSCGTQLATFITPAYTPISLQGHGYYAQGTYVQLHATLLTLSPSPQVGGLLIVYIQYFDGSY